MHKIWHLKAHSLLILLYNSLFLNLDAGILTHRSHCPVVCGLALGNAGIPGDSRANSRKLTAFNKAFRVNLECGAGRADSPLRGVISQQSAGPKRLKSLAFVRTAKGHGSRAQRERTSPLGVLMPEEDDHKMLKDLYLNRDKYFKPGLGKKCNLYRYFGITKENVKEHLDSTMNEYFEKREKDRNKEVYVIDANKFNGNTEWTLPLPRSMSSYKIPEVGTDPIVPMGSEETGAKPEFGNEVLDAIDSMIPEDADEGDRDPKKELVELYEEVGDNDYEAFEDHKEYTKAFFQDFKHRSDEETKRERELLHRVMVQPTAFPSYIDPPNPLHRTGRRRELQRKRDSGT